MENKMMEMVLCKTGKSRLDDKDETIFQKTDDGPALNNKCSRKRTEKMKAKK